MRTDPIVVIVIKNAEGQFFLHQRDSHKREFPDMYGLGAGGHIELDETNRDAAKRELFEETDLSTSVTFLFDFVYQDNESKYPIYVYETTADQDIENHAKEWQWSGWMDEEDIDHLIATKQLMPDTTIIYQRYMSEF